MPDHATAPARLGHRSLRRTAAQAGLVAALLGVFTACAAAAGVGVLLLTTGNDRALSAAVARADGSENSGGFDVTSVLVSRPALDTAAPPTRAADLVPLTRRALAAAAAPYRAQVSLWTSTPMLFLAGRAVRCGYVLDADTLTANASLRTGAWPAAPPDPHGSIPVAVPAATARALGATVGTRLRLSQDRHNGQPVAPFFDLVISGIFEPSRSPAWDRDLLRGDGYDPDFLRLPTFGPFVVAPGTLEARNAPVERIAAVMDPDLAGDASGMPALLGAVDGLGDRIQREAGPAIAPVLVRSGLGPGFSGMRAELSVTNSLVLAVLLLVLVLGAATAALVARVLVARRSAESTLLRDRGGSTAQLVRGATAEAALLVLAAAALAAPLALAAYAVGAPGPGGEAQTPFSTPTGPLLVASLLAGAALPGAVVVIASLPQRPRRGRAVIAGPVARSGVDLMLLAVAVVAYVQLRAHALSPGTVDPLLVAAPALCTLALAALVTRLLPLAARAADGAAGRSRGAVLPLAGWHLARGGAAQGAFLLILATGVTTLGVTFLGSWTASQGDQAAAAVGADLVVAQPGGPGTAQQLAAVTGGEATPVADRPIVLGSRPEGVRVLAIDAGRADAVLRGRLPEGATWSSAMAGLAPPEEDGGLTVAGGPLRVTISGGIPERSLTAGLVRPVVSAAPTLVLADDSGATTSREGAPVLLDGRPHTTTLTAPGQQELPAGRWHVVAIDLLLTDHTTGDLSGWGTNSAPVSLQVGIEGASSTGVRWDAASGTGEAAVQPGDVAVRAGTVSASFTYNVLGLSWEAAHLTLLSFPATTQVPVAVSEPLGAELGLHPGDRIGFTWGTTHLEAVLVRTVSYVPSHVRQAALLADARSLQHALLTAGALEPVTDAWWVNGPRPDAAETLKAQGIGPVTTLAEVTDTLRNGPLRSSLPTAWLLAIGAAVCLALTGSAAHAAAEAQRRAATVARVRALGLSTRDALASHLVQQAAVSTAAVLLGAGCGALLARLLTPLMVVAAEGERAVPAPTVVWSPAPAVALAGAVLLGSVLLSLPAAIGMVRRSTATALRAGEAA